MLSTIDRLIEADRKTPKRIAVIGDSMTDVYIDGRLEECQDGCQKFVEESRIERNGGAANAARSIKNWKSECECFGNTTENGPVKTRFLIEERIIFRHDHGEIDRGDCRREFEVSAMWDWEPDAVLISDYDKGFLTPKVIRHIIDNAKERGIPCVADAKREPEVYLGAIRKCNFDYSVKYASPGDVCTDGWKLPYVREKNIVKLSELCLVQCVNHVGAGDCFAAHLTLALAYGFSLEDAAAVAHSAGRVYVQFPHNRPPQPLEIRADFL